MPWPVAHGPDIHGTYQQLTGEPVDPAWRLFSHKCSEGANSGDAGFPERWKWMREQGFKYRGAYHWLRSDSAISAQAKNVIGRVDAQGGLRQGEFIQSDWETTPGIVVNSARHEREFCDRLEQHYGRACTITYSSDWIPDSPDDPDLLGEFYNWLNVTQGAAPLWFANYNTTPTNPQGGQQECAKYGADVWQFTSSFFHPSIYSPSVGRPEGRGFDMNHVLRWETLDRIAGYRIPTVDPITPPPPSVEEIRTMKIKTPGQWFEKDGMDLRAIANGAEYAGLPGSEVTLTNAEMGQLLATCRHTYGDAKPDMGAQFVADWNAHKPKAASGGGGSVVFPPGTITMSGTIGPA